MAYKKVLEDLAKEIGGEIAAIFPVKFRDYSIELAGTPTIIYPNITPKAIEKLRVDHASLQARIEANIILKKDGKVIDKDKVTLGYVYIPTTRKTFLIDGKEYTLPTQLRLGHAIFPHQKDNGLITAQLNVSKGRGFNIDIDPITKIFKIKIGTKMVGLLPVLRSLGMPDTQIARAWGDDIYMANLKKYPRTKDEKELKKFNQEIAGKSSGDPKITLKAIEGMTFDPELNKQVIGKAIDRLSPEALLLASVKILNISRGKEKPVDRDAVPNKYAIDLDEYLKERIRSSVDTIRNRIIRRIQKYRTVKDIFSQDLITPKINSMFKYYQQVGLAQQDNPAAWAAEFKKTTLTGTGGINDSHRLTLGAIGVNPSSFGVIDPVFTPDGDKIGSVTRLTHGAYTENREIKVNVIDAKTGKKVTVTAKELYGSNWAPEDEYKLKNGKYVPEENLVDGFYKGEAKRFKPSEVKYIVPKHNFFNTVTLTIPFLPSIQGNRAMLATKMVTQAIPLKHREEPLVVPTVNGKRATQAIANAVEDLTIKADSNGTVKTVTDDYIDIIDSSGKIKRYELYNYAPLNGESFINHEPVVKVGDRVRKGQVIAESNFTKNNDLALGVNLRVGYLPFHGKTLDDAIVISESAAKKLTSEHLHKIEVPIDPDKEKMDIRFYQSLFPGRLTAEKAQKLGQNGVIRKGETIKPGDYIFVKVRKRLSDASDLARVDKTLVKPWIDVSEKWEEDVPGKVIRSIVTPSRISVHIVTEEPATIGDKLTNRHANKGVISAIIPDDEMPKVNGKPLEILISPLAIPSRINVSQILETAAAKVAEKTGKPIEVEQFTKDDHAEMVKSLLKKHGLVKGDDYEDIADYKGHKIKVMSGPQYFYKLEHQGRKKLSARYRGAYDSDLHPTKGPTGSAGEAMDTLTLYSLMAHNAKKILDDTLYKGEKNEEFWKAVEMGLPTPPLKTPFSTSKLFDLMRAAGINVAQGTNIAQLLPARDKDIEIMSSGEIKNAETIYAKNLKPIKGGLYDPTVTGGLKGRRWGHINLADKIPNPIVINYLAPLYGLKTSQVEDIARNKLWIDPVTMDISRRQKEGYYTGWDAFKRLNKKINIDERIKKLNQKVKREKNTTRLNSYVRQLRLLRTLKNNHMSLDDLFLSKMPVLPPVMRPTYMSEDGQIISSDLNKFYRNVLLTSEKYKELKELGVPDTDSTMRKLKAKLYDEYKAYQGLTKPGKTNDALGILNYIRGREQAKHGFFWHKTVNRKQDLSGHGVMGPDITLGLNEIAMPEQMAWVLYAPFVIRRLIKSGYTPLEARKHLQDRDDVAYAALQQEVKERPVLGNRNPSLHKYNILALYPKLVKGTQLRVNPLINKGYNLDFDGDTFSIYVPVTEEAKEEAKKITPTNVMIHPATHKSLYHLFQDSVYGIYLGTASGGKHTNLTYNDIESLQRDLDAAKVSPTDQIRYKGMNTTVGRALVNEAIPQKYRDYNKQWDKKSISDVVNSLVKTDPNEASNMIADLQRIGAKLALYTGATVGLSDLDVPKSLRNKLLSIAETEIKKRGANAIPSLVNKANEIMQTALPQNRFVIMSKSGAKGNPVQIRQILLTPLFVNDNSGKPIPKVIKQSYSEGLKITDYLLTQFGARMGALGRKKAVAEPGALTKLVVSSAATEVVSMHDCGTTDGIEYPITEPSIEGRFLAKPAGGKPRNTLLDDATIDDLKRKGVKKVVVRSPLKCMATRGVCQMCYGLKPDGHLPAIGDNVGIEAAQYLTEPMTQAAMVSFHTGGVATGKTETMNVYGRVEEIFKQPQLRPTDAVLSEVTGTVTQIKKDPAGGWDVIVKDADGVEHSHYVNPVRKVMVKVRDKVNAGDALTDGNINYKEFARLKGVESAQKALLHELSNIYDKHIRKTDKKIVETVVKSMTTNAVIEDHGDNEFFLKGDGISLNAANKLNMAVTSGMPVNVDIAAGYKLRRKYGPYDAGTLITPEVIDTLKRNGIYQVTIKGKPLKVQPVMMGVAQVPPISTDWTERIPSQRMVDRLVDSTIRGLYADIKNPFAPISKYILARNKQEAIK